MTGLFPLSAPARTIIVDPSHPEAADFGDLPAAITAASAGDTILLAPDDYGDVSLDKPLHLVGAGYFLGEIFRNLPNRSAAIIDTLYLRRDQYVGVAVGRISAIAAPEAWIDSVAGKPCLSYAILHDDY